jgi:hypothetical protein
MMNLRIENIPMRATAPARSRQKQNKPFQREASSPKCATDRDQNYSANQAIGLAIRCTKQTSATLPGVAARPVTILWFMVRERFRQKLEAANEPAFSRVNLHSIVMNQQ